jgi:hypothetical protein
MSLVLRGVLDEIASAGPMKGKVQREALDLVDALVRGEPPTPETMDRARAEISKFNGRVGMGSTAQLVALSYMPVELVLRMLEDGEDLTEAVLGSAAVALGRLCADPARRVEALLARAKAAAAGFDEGPAVPAPPQVDDGPLGADLPAVALAHLAARKATRSGKHGDADTTQALLAKHGIPAHAAVRAFEAAYGGLEIVESDPHAPALVVGPVAFFSALPSYTGRHGDLVPVMIAWNDVYYALDAKGRGFTNAAMVEGVFRPSAKNGRALLTQAILWRALETHPEGFVSCDGLRGAELAKARGLPRVAGATGDTERWWGAADGMRLVVEIDRGNGYQAPRTYATARERIG